MCLVIYKPAGVEIPISYLKNGWEHNSDGAGFMWTHESKVYGSKGYMKYEYLMDTLRQLNFVKDDKLSSHISIAVHFRLATHGGVSPGKCHPFPASVDEDELHLLEWQHDYGIAHNGIVSDFAEKGLSDTQGFIKHILSDRNTLEKLPYEETIQSLLGKITLGSKFIILSADDVVFLGNWIKEGGAYYSNNDFKIQPRAYYYKNYNMYDDYEDYSFPTRHDSTQSWPSAQKALEYLKDREESGETIDMIEYFDKQYQVPNKLYDFCELQEDCSYCEFSYLDEYGLVCEVWERFFPKEVEEFKEDEEYKDEFFRND